MPARLACRPLGTRRPASPGRAFTATSVCQESIPSLGEDHAPKDGWMFGRLALRHAGAPWAGGRPTHTGARVAGTKRSAPRRRSRRCSTRVAVRTPCHTDPGSGTNPSPGRCTPQCPTGLGVVPGRHLHRQWCPAVGVPSRRTRHWPRDLPAPYLGAPATRSQKWGRHQCRAAAPARAGESSRRRSQVGGRGLSAVSAQEPGSSAQPCKMRVCGLLPLAPARSHLGPRGWGPVWRPGPNSDRARAGAGLETWPKL